MLGFVVYRKNRLASCDGVIAPSHFEERSGWGPVVPGVCTVHRLVLTPTVTTLEPHAALCPTIKFLSGNSADYKHAVAEDLGRMGLVARTEGIFYGSPMGRDSDRTAMAVVAEINDDADRFLWSVVSGRPLSRSVMHAAANFGTIPLRDGSTKADAKLLMQPRRAVSSTSRALRHPWATVALKKV